MGFYGAIHAADQQIQSQKKFGPNLLANVALAKRGMGVLDLYESLVADFWCTAVSSRLDDLKQMRSKRSPTILVVALCGAILSAISPAMGIYGLVRITDLQKRDYLEYGFERTAWALATLSILDSLLPFDSSKTLQAL